MTKYLEEETFSKVIVKEGANLSILEVPWFFERKHVNLRIAGCSFDFEQMFVCFFLDSSALPDALVTRG